MEQGYARSSVDNEAVVAVSLADLRRIGDDCTGECERRTKRFVDDIGIKPWGFAWYVEWCARDRRDEMMKKCMVKCRDIATICPSTEQIERGLKAADALVLQQQQQTAAPSSSPASSATGAAAAASQSASSPAGYDRTAAYQAATTNMGDPMLLASAEAADCTPYRWRRCEAVTGEFAKMLFTVAQKPSKVGFEDRDRDKKRDMMMGGGATGPKSGLSQDWESPPVTTDRATPVASRYAGAMHQPLPAHLTTHLTDEHRAALERMANPGLKAQLFESVMKAQAAQNPSGKPSFGYGSTKDI